MVLSEDLAKYDAQFESATNKIIDVLRGAFKGDESRVDNACRIADRTYCIIVLTDNRTTGILCHELSMYPLYVLRLMIGNSMKHRVDKPIADIMDTLVKVVIVLSNLMIRK